MKNIGVVVYAAKRQKRTAFVLIVPMQDGEINVFLAMQWSGEATTSVKIVIQRNGVKKEGLDKLRYFPLMGYWPISQKYRNLTKLQPSVSMYIGEYSGL